MNSPCLVAYAISVTIFFKYEDMAYLFYSLSNVHKDLQKYHTIFFKLQANIDTYCILNVSAVVDNAVLQWYWNTFGSEIQNVTLNSLYQDQMQVLT